MNVFTYPVPIGTTLSVLIAHAMDNYGNISSTGGGWRRYLDDIGRIRPIVARPARGQ